jgi:hypothetical protein
MCARQEAFSELVLAGSETGFGTTRIAMALAGVLGAGDHSDQSPDSVAALDRWTHLVQARPRSGSVSSPCVASVKDDVAIRYGGVSAFTRC